METVLEEEPETETKKQEYQTDDGMKLVLTEDKDGQITGILEEDLELSHNRSNLENLLKILEIFTTIESIDRKYTSGPNGGGEKTLVTELKLNKKKKFEGLEKERLQQIILYKNLQKTLNKRMKVVEEERLAFPRSALDYIEYWTHLSADEICYTRNTPFPSLKKKYEVRARLLDIADFVREFYGIIQIKTGITRKRILSDAKDTKTARERAIMMYLLRKEFDFLSFPNIGKIMGEIGKPKHHATVIVNLKKFNPEELDQEFYKKASTLELYKKTKRNYNPKRPYETKIQV